MTGLRRMARPALVALVLVVVTANVAAQLEEEFESVFPFLGRWDSQITSPGGQDRGSCGGRTGDYGEKLLNCSMPVDQLPLNVRGEAWMAYVDLFQSPTTAECAMLSLPAMLGDDFDLTAQPGRLNWLGGQGNERTIWMNGAGPTPRTGELFQQGYSVGHFEDGDLVIENTNFTFDPDGMDDHLLMASSVLKKITQRYHLINENHLRLIITLEDPIFLTEPFTWAFVFTRVGNDGPSTGWRNCDAESARREQDFAYPGNKYPDAR